jgi:hypothetical protein
MLREDIVVGVTICARREVPPFTAKQIELVQTARFWHEQAHPHRLEFGRGGLNPWRVFPCEGQAAQGDRSRDAILGDHLLIELEAEAWARRHSHEAGLESRPVRPHGLPDRIAVGIGEALEIGAVRHGGD